MEPVRNSVIAVMACVAPLISQNAGAQNTSTPWQVKKCQIYRSAWKDLPKLVNADAFTAKFKALNEEFMASGCLAHTKICPENPAETKAANILTIASMNGGTASTFLPFRC